MNCLRRSALRAISSSPTSLLSKSHCLPAASAFPHKPAAQSLAVPVSRLFSNNAVRAYSQEEARKEDQEDSAPTSADSEEQSSISEAVSSVSDAVSSSASSIAHEAREATESARSSFDSAKDSIMDTARGAANAVSNQGDRLGIRPGRVMAPTNTIYVGNLLFEVTEDDLKALFDPYGRIMKVKVARDFRMNSKGFAYIEFATVEEANAAIAGQNQEIFAGRKLSVNYMVTKLGGNQGPVVKNSPTKTLFIGNLAYEMSDADLNKLFRDIRNVIDVRVAIDRRTGQPRGFAHADFVDIQSAEAAMAHLQGKEFYGRALRIDYSGNAVRKPTSNMDADPYFNRRRDNSRGNDSNDNSGNARF